MASFNGNSYSKPESAAERRQQREDYRRQQRARVAVLSLNGKTKVLARAIVSAVKDRGSFSELDGVQAFLTPSEVQSLYPGAIEIARTIEPRLPDMVAA